MLWRLTGVTKKL